MVVVIVVVVEGAFLGRRWKLCFSVDVEVVGVGVVVGVGRCCLSVVVLALLVGRWRCCLWSLVVDVGRWRDSPFNKVIHTMHRDLIRTNTTHLNSA